MSAPGDALAMQRALAYARRGDGRCFPNPAVGAVVVRGGRVLGGGVSRPAGGAHAEVVAIESVRRRHGAKALRGAALYVTLEPCCSKGRTGPCTEAILAAGIGRVVAGVQDPHPKVRGRGFARLRGAGVEVEVGVLAERCRRQHRGFFSLVERGRPWLALKLAATLDGRIATATGESRWITGAVARALVHQLRDRHDAVMIGSGTLRADDPALTVRRKGRRERTPLRILVDSRLAAPPAARMLSDAFAAQSWCLTRRGAAPAKRRRLAARGVRVLDVPVRGGHLDLHRALAVLGAQGLTRVLVEGGGGLAAALLRRDLVDEIHWFAAPSLLGADARPAVAELGIRRIARRLAIEVEVVRRLGADLYLQGMVQRETGS